MGKRLFILYESAFGFCLFKVKDIEEIAIKLTSKAIKDYGKFSLNCKLYAHQSFSDQQQALDTVMQLCDEKLPEHLKDWLQLVLPKSKEEGKKPKFILGTSEANLGKMIKAELNYKCRSDNQINEIVRGIRYHFAKFMKKSKILKKGFMEKLQLGLSHCYSRTKVQYDKKKIDNMVIQAICTLDQLDKDINTFVMRCKEWFGWHFPELVKIVPDPLMYCRVVRLIKSRDQMGSITEAELGDLVLDESLGRQIIEAAKLSAGTEMNPLDQVTISRFADRVVSLCEYRKSLWTYLSDKMDAIAPNLTALIGELVGARLISHAGSLRNLAKYPASTVQILGAEKALFRALKKGGNTPKYGLIFHSTFIGRAEQKNKGRISRYLANKAALASRIDCFSEESTNVWGVKFREQVEERLEFFKTAKVPRKNAEVIQEALEILKGEAAPTTKPEGEGEPGEEATVKETKSEKIKEKEGEVAGEVSETTTEQVAEEAAETEKTTKKKKKKKKRKRETEGEEGLKEPSKKKTKVDEGTEAEGEPTPVKKKDKSKKEKKKKKKKRKREEAEDAPEETSESTKKKKKKKKKKKHE